MLHSTSLLLSLALWAPPLQPVATQAGDEAQAESTPTPLLSIETQGCDGFFVDEKDLAFRDALRLLGDRIQELPRELPDFDAPPELLRLVVRLFSGPMSLTVSHSPRAIAGMPVPLAAELRLTQSDAGAARALGDEMAGWFDQFGMQLDAPDRAGTRVLPLPVPMWMGSAESDFHWRLGLEEGVALPSQAGLLPPGARMSFGGMMDYGAILELVQEFAGGDRELEQLFDLLDAFGLEELRYSWAYGIDAERSHFVFEMPGLAATAEEAGLMSSEVLTPDMVALIPEDATWAGAYTMDLVGAYDAYQTMMGEMVGMDLDAWIAENTGLDMRRDVLAAMGGHAAIYASDSTGGGGFLSTVAVIEVGDGAAFERTWQKLEQATADFGQQEAKGYLRFSHFEQDGLELGVLSFPGLPIPLELCFTRVESYFVLGVTPQAVVVAADQVRSGSRGLLDNPHFQEQLGDDLSGIISMSWINTPRLLQEGYGTMSLMSSALANLVRSPHDSAREPGVLMPTFRELRAEAKGILSLSRRVGDDLRSETRADRSQLVNGTGLVGYAYSSPIAILVGVGLGATMAMPQLMSMRGGMTSQAEEAFVFDFDEAEVEVEDVDFETIVSEDFVAIYAAFDAYRANNGGRYPGSLDELTTPDSNGERYLDPAHLIDPWGDAYLYTAPKDEHSQPNLELQD